MSYAVEYFNQRVMDEIESWPVGILADYARVIKLLFEFGPALRMPHSRAMGSGLFELRPCGPEGVARVFYCYASGQRIVMLHAFIKKTRTTPTRDLDTARRRMKRVCDG
ncbi:MAG: type II toxin-antitoxin system RelE/ParE family toxin [Coriobacteriia bacterium]|nr:type II toxin-antitoxin system RelE/ParE family toxin [Coriobacteriia bacterium]